MSVDREVCLHEAAHAVVAHELGAPVRRVIVAPAGGWVELSDGTKAHGIVDCAHAELLPLERVAIFYAGLVADRRLGRDDMQAAIAASHDMDTVAEILRQTTASRREAELLRDCGKSLALRLVRQHWQSIKRVAARLEATRGDIDGETMVAAIEAPHPKLYVIGV